MWRHVANSERCAARPPHGSTQAHESASRRSRTASFQSPSRSVNAGESASAAVTESSKLTLAVLDARELKGVPSERAGNGEVVLAVVNKDVRIRGLTRARDDVAEEVRVRLCQLCQTACQRDPIVSRNSSTRQSGLTAPRIVAAPDGSKCPRTPGSCFSGGHGRQGQPLRPTTLLPAAYTERRRPRKEVRSAARAAQPRPRPVRHPLPCLGHATRTRMPQRQARS